MTGLDACENNVTIAKNHAELDPNIQGRIRYMCSTIEEHESEIACSETAGETVHCFDPKSSVFYTSTISLHIEFLFNHHIESIILTAVRKMV